MTRVTYKQHDNVLYNKHVINTEKESFHVNINIITFNYVISKETDPDVLLAEGKARSVSEAKKLVKDSLRTLGVTFGTDLRNRKLITLEEK